MQNEVQQALAAFSARYCEAWRQQRGSLPVSEEYIGISSPCIVSTHPDAVEWEPQPFTPEDSLGAVEKALDIVIQPDAHAFYASQYAGDMAAQYDDVALTLLQAWSQDDFRRVQENLIGHLVTQKRLKLSPTIFIATLDSELDVISLCNLTGEVVQETLGTRKRRVLAPSLSTFLSQLTPSCNPFLPAPV
ncbi:SecY-interacting protein [Cronobacter sakazakii]|uniref:SecY-interacting protein n=1 Tax=Cronobacter sakazakii TaxID=28141 RepID=UPI000BE84128|nr:SecY-interacting protein [Cronobacter sakazakii]EKC6205992.1 SecY-interacting protein [Cronobacter sakazakii]EKD3163033.1 SecY-interacting protein [Cronobacter sakazakii]EKD3181911.1 SecY-interacting protein [Cronobacter sakazakii]EKD3191197.1 SecY-interacting protein [Cronobacter sakazakii]EKD3199700.1 SecY-interacting protein [Cronobacter sakazakii]